MKEEILLKYPEFLRFRESLLLYGRRFKKISYEDLEEIVNDSVISALENFIEEKGSFEAYCRLILKCRLINFLKSSKENFLLTLLGDEENITDNDTVTIEEKEKNRIALEFINSLRIELSKEEAKFFNAVYQVCERSDIKLIAEASKIAGVTNQKGWDIFRRIQRKAVSINKDKINENYIYRKVSDIHKELIISEIESMYDFQKPFYQYSGLEKFIKLLNKEKLVMINKIYDLEE
ncbi:MAG: hypothetical protein JSS91_12100 [Bacteroidetes bacterium]|nr:hypothetical protein [Bacteroidota bacterium]